MLNTQLIDYTNCITNFTSSIEKHYGLKPSYNTMPALDKILAEKKYRNIAIVLFDALGCSVLERNKFAGRYFRKHLVHQFVSCYPPTTATCTTAYRSGKNGIESGWIGWCSYVKPLDRTIETFTNKYMETKEPYEGPEWISEYYFYYTPLGEKIEKETGVKYVDLSPMNPSSSLQERHDQLLSACKEEGKHYIYMYWGQPDSTMHKFGVSNRHVRKQIRINTRFMKKIQKETDDTLFLVVADHGMTDIKRLEFFNTELPSMLRAFPSCDGRTPFFFVKPGMQEQFKTKFNELYGEHYHLMTTQEAKDLHLFGKCDSKDQHYMYDDLFGDFVAVATDEYYLSFSPNFKHFKGHHAGLTAEEMQIPLIVLESTEK